MSPSKCLRLLFVLSALVTADTRAAEPEEHLAPLAPFVGRTWRGEFADSTPEKPVVDVQRWEWSLNGKGVRIVHSMNDGEYGGETTIVYDRERERLIYFYFTTQGFYTTGTIVVGEGMYVAHEEVTGSDEGITAVRSTSLLLPDGSLQTSSEFFKDEQWVPGFDVTYEEDPTAEVIFATVDHPQD